MKGKTPVSKEMEEGIIDELIFLANNSAEEYFVRHTVRPIVRDIIRSYLEKEVEEIIKEIRAKIAKDLWCDGCLQDLDRVLAEVERKK